MVMFWIGIAMFTMGLILVLTANHLADKAQRRYRQALAVLEEANQTCDRVLQSLGMWRR